MKVRNTAIPVGLSMPTGKVGREWTKVYIDKLGEFIDLMRIDSMRFWYCDQPKVVGINAQTLQLVRYHDLKVELLSKGAVVAKGRLPC